MTPIVTTGPLNRRLNIVFLPDGYTAAQEAAFLTQARKVAGGLVSSDPFGEFAFKLNFWAQFVPSKDAGISKPLLGISKDTYFQCFYGWGGVQRCIGSTHGSLIKPLLGEVAQHLHIPIILCNESERGGGGGPFVCASKGMSIDDIMHELGHFFGLEDEYFSAGTTGHAVPAPNVAVSLDEIPWHDRIAPGTPVPTKVSTANNAKIGAFEGASGIAKGVWRPFTDCKMRNAAKPWCPICRDHIITKLLEIYQ